MHMLSARHYDEFMAVPTLCRVAMAHGAGGLEPTLLIKADSLILKAIWRGAKFVLRVRFEPEEGVCLYGVEIFDDSENPALIWSVVEEEQELEALKLIVDGKNTPIFLFNELALNVLDAYPPGFTVVGRNREFSISSAPVSPKLTMESQTAIGKTFPKTPDERNKYWNVSLVPSISIVWHEIKNTYITNTADSSEIHILNQDEGGQQEQLALWLADGLSLKGVAINPEIRKGKSRRELCDLFFGYENGTFLFESKCVSVFNKSEIPDRTKIRKTLIGHVEKARRQLAGACRKMRRGEPIYFNNAEISNFDRTKAAHCIVLVSDLVELNESGAVTIEQVKDFGRDNEGMLQFLDLAELLHLVQGAHLFQENGDYSLMFYFDYILMERWKRTLDSGEPVIHLLTHRGKHDSDEQMER